MRGVVRAFECAWRFDVMWHISVRIRESAPLPAVAASSRCTGNFPQKCDEALFCVAVAQGDGVERHSNV